MENNPLLIIRIGTLTPRTPVGSQCSSVWPPCFRRSKLGQSNIPDILLEVLAHGVGRKQFPRSNEGQMTGTGGTNISWIDHSGGEMRRNTCHDRRMCGFAEPYGRQACFDE
jgi:hypothetical protein